jgi:hypothetical protein
MPDPSKESPRPCTLVGPYLGLWWGASVVGGPVAGVIAVGCGSPAVGSQVGTAHHRDRSPLEMEQMLI